MPTDFLMSWIHNRKQRKLLRTLSYKTQIPLFNNLYIRANFSMLAFYGLPHKLIKNILLKKPQICKWTIIKIQLLQLHLIELVHQKPRFLYLADSSGLVLETRLEDFLELLEAV